MQRRNFIKTLFPMAAAPLALNGIPIRAMANTLLTRSFTCEELGDRALVLIQLHGGNDGLNMLVPVDQYATYKNLRPIIGILDQGPRRYLDLDNSLPVQDQVGLHPDMGGLKSLYDDGKVNFIQEVSYSDNNRSHFRGADIWLSGKDAQNGQEVFESGWFGRYLDHRFPNYPGDYPSLDMPDPPGLEFGSCVVSLGFHRQAGIPMGLAMGNDPTDFYNLVSGVGGVLPDTIPQSHYGDELQYLIDVEKSTDVYAQRLTDVYSQGNNTPGVIYPEHYHTQASRFYYNQLAPQLKTVARLLAGGIKTKIFLVRLMGFDTHENQAIAGKPSFGGHGCLMYHLSEAIQAFQADLEGLGLEDRVLTATFSEFGRQVAENGTFGTDHGTSAPMLVVGKGVNGGVTGTNPNIANLNNNNLQGFQHDYRQIFTTLLQDWLGANDGTLEEVEFRSFSQKKLPLVNSNYQELNGDITNYIADPDCDPTPISNPTPIETSEVLTKPEVAVFPNPASENLNISINSSYLSPVTLSLYSSQGQKVREKAVAIYAGSSQHILEIQDLSTGLYVLQVVAHKGSVSAQIWSTQKVMISH